MLLNKVTRVLLLLGGVIAVGAIIFAIKSTQETQALRSQLEEVKKSSPAASQEEVKKITEEVGQLIILPEGENPTLATITDKEKLKDVPFFSKAENGDKVLIYVNTRKAILYRPGNKKIIEVATLNLSTNNTAVDQNFAPK